MSEEKDLTALEGEEPEGEEPEGEEPEGDNPEGDKGNQPDKNPEDTKEHNRKGYQARQHQKVEKDSKIDALSKKLENVEAKIETMTEVSKDSDFRKTHPEISDELFNLIKSSSKGSGKTYDESLNDPVIKKVIETETTKTRIEGATPAPSTKSSPGGSKSVWDMDQDEFKNYQEEVLRRG